MGKLNNLGLAFALALASAGPSVAESTRADPEARRHWYQSITVGYQTLADRTNQFQAAVETYCDAPAVPSREGAEQAWLDAFLAWQKVRFIDFGPIEKNNLGWQFQFWPDPKNLIARKANGLLNPDLTITPELIDDSGVAVQGFPMAEYLLFDEPLNAGEQALPALKTCELLTAVAVHVVANSRELKASWQGFEKHYLTTDQYRDTTIRSAMAALEILEERRLAEPMGLRDSGGRSQYGADAWRSGTSLKAAEATLTGLEQHFLPGLILLLEKHGDGVLARRIDKQFADALANFPELHQPMKHLLADDALFTELQSFYVDVSQLAELVNGQAAVKLGVVRGFNSSDGD
ncbi:imelysin family protein [Marinobacter halotolerans]|uniref:imelysin family protein n=1 Tax=Marinobacter halotolerans TaxID=1569211 RepID=UPI001246E476|nr:imelysin family protein [Marinobacter halotolerans]